MHFNRPLLFIQLTKTCVQLLTAGDDTLRVLLFKDRALKVEVGDPLYLVDAGFRPHILEVLDRLRLKFVDHVHGRITLR